MSKVFDVLAIAAVLFVWCGEAAGLQTKPAFAVEVYPADSTNMEPGVLSFTDKGDGVVQLEALLCGKYLVFTYDTKLAPIEEFEGFINETVERVCGP